MGQCRIREVNNVDQQAFLSWNIFGSSWEVWKHCIKYDHAGSKRVSISNRTRLKAIQYRSIEKQLTQ